MDDHEEGQQKIILSSKSVASLNSYILFYHMGLCYRRLVIENCGVRKEWVS